MRRDLYSYGRPEPTRPGAPVLGPGAVETFVCASCGCSAIAADADLMVSLGWRILSGHDGDLERRALCAACARKGLTGVL